MGRSNPVNPPGLQFLCLLKSGRWSSSKSWKCWRRRGRGPPEDTQDNLARWQASRGAGPEQPHHAPAGRGMLTGTASAETVAGTTRKPAHRSRSHDTHDRFQNGLPISLPPLPMHFWFWFCNEAATVLIMRAQSSSIPVEPLQGHQSTF